MNIDFSLHSDILSYSLPNKNVVTKLIITDENQLKKKHFKKEFGDDVFP